AAPGTGGCGRGRRCQAASRVRVAGFEADEARKTGALARQATPEDGSRLDGAHRFTPRRASRSHRSGGRLGCAVDDVRVDREARRPGGAGLGDSASARHAPGLPVKRSARVDSGRRVSGRPRPSDVTTADVTPAGWRRRLRRVRGSSMATEAVALTRDLVRVDTINPPGAEAPCVQQVARLLEAAGFELRTYDFAPGRTSLVARIGGRADAPPLCFTGHVDTVPLGGQPWTRDPHAAEIAAGRLYGPGSTDTKSGLAAFVTATIELAPHLARTAGVVLVITAGEETGCDGARHLVSLPGVLGCAGAIVVAEPTGNEPLVGHKGALWLQARTSGVTAHGSMPERGVNAISKAARAVTRLEQFTFDVPPHPVLGRATLNVGTIAGGLNVNSVPDAATIGIDIRTIPRQPHAASLRRLRHYLP